MPQTFLLTYNPTRWDWTDREETLRAIQTSKSRGFLHRWSAGPHPRRIGPGDEVYLLRQGPEPRGIIASGEVVSEVQQDKHWDEDQGLANYVEVRWTTAVAADDPLPLAALKEVAPGQNWHPRAGGTQLRDDVVTAVDQLWRDHAGR
ncbi:EVE domain-containing protein [Nocardioides sp. Y6]|uniref:EVE domain-containing protein n=1 Tax=Nocardioides malaquae TaxID=2773426 RepID=A0ABR9RPS5_9ACTN|nr:EVE domain-containing protein [Nocardioides malaquae]MBE7323559.1 EVE domain-containing protein [Nocardioides malaquae]